MQLILASASPRRRDILTSLGVDFTVCPATGEEKAVSNTPTLLVEELAKQKGKEVYLRLKGGNRLPADALILSSDTVVAVDDEILGKPKDRADAHRMLHLLSGRAHEVVSGICFTTAAGEQFASHDVTRVFFDLLSDDDIEAYLDAERTDDKAGAYAIQSKASLFISGIEGDYFNVVGLPVHELARLFREKIGGNFPSAVEKSKKI